MAITGGINIPTTATGTAEFAASGTVINDSNGVSLGITFSNAGQATRIAYLLNLLAGTLGSSRTPG